MLRLENGTELFSDRDINRLRTPSSGRMGATTWVSAPAEATATDSACTDHGECQCGGRCVRCACAERRAAQAAQTLPTGPTPATPALAVPALAAPDAPATARS